MPAPSARAVCTPESSSRSPLPDFLAGDSEELSVQVSALGCIGGSEDRRARTEDKTRDEVFSGCREEAPASTASSPSRGVRQDEENGNAQVAAPAPGGCGGRAPSPPALFRQNPGGKRARMTLTQTGRDEQQGVATDSANRAVAKRGRAHAARHAQRRSDASEERKGRREVETQNQKETSDAASEVCKQNAATPSPLPHPAIPLREMEGCRRSATSSRPAARAEAARQPRGSLAGADSPVARPKEGRCAESDEASHRGCQARPGTDDDLGQRDSEQEQPSEEKEALSCASAQARASSEALAASASSAGPATAAVTEGSLADMGRKREREGAVGEREGAVGEREPRQPNGTTSGAAEGRARREGRHTEAEARSDEAAAGSEEGGAPTPRPRAQNAVGPAPGVCPRPQGSGDRRRQSRDRRESESGRAGDSDPERGDRARNAAVASERAETEEQVEDGHSSCWRGGIDGRAGHAARAESSAGEGDCEDGDSPEEQRPAARLRNPRAPTRPARGEARRAQAAPPGAEEMAKANRRGVETGKSSHIRDRSLHMPAPDAAEIVGREQGAGEAGNVTPESAAASLDSGEEHEAQTRDGARAREQEEEEASDGRRAVKDRVGGGTDQERTESQDHESDDGGSFALMRESEQDLLPPRSPQSSRGRVPRLSLEVLRASEEDCARDSSSSSSRSARLWVESDDASRDEGGCLSAHQRDEEETAGAEREETAHDEPCVLSSFASVEAVLRIAGKVSFECLASFCCDYLRQLNLHLRSMREVSLQREKKLAALLTRRDARTSPRFRASSSGSVSSPSLPASPPSSRSSGDGGCPHDAGPQRRRRQRRRAARSPRRGAGARGDRRGESEDEHSEISVADEMPATDARGENGRASRAGGRRRAVWVGAAFERLKRERLSRLLNVQRCCQECTEPVLQVLSVAYLVRLFLWSRDAHPDGRAFPVSPETLAMLIEALDAHRLLLVRLYKIQFPSLDLAVSSLALLYSQSVAVQRILPVLLGLFRSEFGDSAASLVLHVRPARPLPKGGGRAAASPPPLQTGGGLRHRAPEEPGESSARPPSFSAAARRRRRLGRCVRGPAGRSGVSFLALF
ncbi:hypothetical protein BESB_026100 [Besnoitia besnoiti]|uniref:Uncharacterized protein n=1 Tax=Besnoitia besnoiti TaxID=94643 RepID=A0A2A9M6X0_BESBE|nr:uncharacterized protein BESB_026100 [Besnoitia besnoiti]PFH31636.1 hypothetical protein BESB_026100 [Besnoitia besnoiti]